MRWQSDEHLEQKDTQRVIVNGVVVALPEQYLRTHVLGAAHEGHGTVASLAELASTQSEVCQAQMAALIHQDVLRLQVTIEDVVTMQEFDGKDHLSEEKLCVRELKALELL